MGFWVSRVSLFAGAFFPRLYWLLSPKIMLSIYTNGCASDLLSLCLTLNCFSRAEVRAREGRGLGYTQEHKNQETTTTTTTDLLVVCVLSVEHILPPGVLA